MLDTLKALVSDIPWDSVKAVKEPLLAPIAPSRKSHGYWKSKSNQRKFFDELAVSLNIQKKEDWDTVKLDTVIKRGGSFVFNHYSGSLSRGIADIFTIICKINTYSIECSLSWSVIG